MSYVFGTAPVVASANQTVDAFERQTGSLEAIILNGAVTSNVDLGTSATDSSSVTTNANTAAATVVSNSATSSLDIGLVSGTGSTSNGVIASALENNGSDAFATVNATVVTSTVTDPASGSSVSLSNNTLSAATTLATATNTLQGDINLNFANTDDGAVNTGAGTSTAGLLIGSAQVNNDVQNDTPNDTGATFAGVTGDSNVVLTLEDSAATGNISTVTANVNDNTASASFVGNTVDNLLDVQAGNLTTLSSSAGINNVQSNDNVGVSGTTALTNAVVDSDVGITATVASDDAVSNSTINVSGNTLSSSSSLSSAESDLVVAAGISVAGPSDDSYAATVSGSLTSTTSSADLFVANTQNAQDSVSRAVTNGDDGIDVSVASSAGGEVTASSILTSSNELSASATGNTNASTLTVTDSTSFVGLVASSNVQSFTDNTDDALTSNVAATVSDPRLAISIAEGAGATVTGSTLRADENELSASAVANASSSAVSVTGTDVSSGKDVTDEVAPNADFTNGVSGGSDTIASSTGADIVAVNQQAVSNDDGNADTVVSATLTDTADSAISLTVGDDDAVTNSTLSVDRNDLTATAGSNEAATSVSVSANTLTGSSGVANNQDSVGAVAAVVDDMNVALTVDSDGAATSALSLSADANTIAGSAAGNIGTNTLDVTAETQTFVNTVAVTDPTGSRNTLVLSGLDNAGVGSQASAELSVLSAQETKGGAGQSVSSNVDDSNVAATLAVADQNLTATSLSVDSNVMSASARANVVTNTLDADVDSLVLTNAVRDTDGDTNSAGGTNIAAVGSLQANALAVTANLDTDTDNTSINAEITATGTVDDVTLSADANRRTAFASGNTATNTLELSGGSIVTLESAAPDPSLTLLDDATTDITASNTAIALGNEQRNSGAISANVATTDDDQIQAVITGAATVTDTTVSMDRNTVLAQARGASAATNNVRIGIADIDPATGLPVADEQNSTSIQTSVLVGSSQENSGAITANAGTGGTAEIEIGGGFTGGTQTRVTLSADSNVVGAEATALVDNSSLTVGSADATSVLASNSNVSDGDVGIDFTAGTSVVTVADYAVSARQTNSADGDVTVAAENLLIDLDAASLVTGSVSADGNLLTGQATGISGSTAVTVTAGDLGSAGSAPVLAGSSIQTNAGDVSGTLEDAAIDVDVADLASVAGSAESVSIDRNRLLAQATGVTGTNAVTASATTGAGALTTAADGGIDGGGRNFTAEADRMLASEQSSAGAITANVAQSAVDANPRLELTVGGDVDADSLSIVSNTIQGQARAIVGVNTLTNTAGTSMNASSALVANQATTSGAISSMVTEPRIVNTATGTVEDSTLDVVSNTVSASASQISGTNTLTTTGGAIDGATSGETNINSNAALYSIANEGFSTLTSKQETSGTSAARIADDGTDTPATIGISLGSSVTQSAVSVDLNTIEAASTIASGANTLTQSADTSQAVGSSAMLASVQRNTVLSGASSSTIEGLDISLVSSGTTSAADMSVDANTVQALATGLTVANVLDIDAGGTISGSGAGTFRSLGLAADADYSLFSVQVSPGVSNATIAADEDGTDPAIRLTNGGPGSQVDGSSLSLSSNVVQAQAIGVTATNSADADFNTASSASFVVSSDQDGGGRTQSTVASPQVSVDAGGILNRSAVEASSNRILSLSTGVNATNELTLSGASIDGSVSSSLTSDRPATRLSSDASAAVLSVQEYTRDAIATVSDTANSGPSIRVTSSPTPTTVQAVLGSTVSVDSNVIQAAATRISAANTLRQETDTSQADGSGAQVASLQRDETGNSDGIARVNAASIGVTTTETAHSSSVTANANTVQALATGFTVANTLDIGAGTSVSGDGTGTVDMFAASSGDIISDVDYALTNEQTLLGTGEIISSLGTGSSSSGTLISVDIGGNLTVGTFASVSSNTLRSQSIMQDAMNVLSADVGSVNEASFGLASNQLSNNALSAAIIAPTIRMTGSLVSDSTLSVSDNLMVASGTAALVTNSLTVDAATSIAGGGDGVGLVRVTSGPSSIAIDPDAAGGSAAGDPVASLFTSQSSLGAIDTQVVGADGIGTPSIVATIGQNVTGTINVDGNAVLSQSRGNVATSSLALNAGSTLEADAQGILASRQSREGAITTSVAGAPDGTRGTIGFSNTNAPINGAISVDNNTVRASGAANVAMNSFTVDAGLIGAPTGAATFTAGNIETNAQFAALNAQTNASAVTVDVTDFSVALNQTGGGVSAFNGSASVSGNLVMADATGNSATNMMTLASGGTSFGTASFVNYQANTAALSATVTRASVSMDVGHATAGASSGTFNIGGNAIMANATGNTATTSVRRDGFSFSNN